MIFLSFWINDRVKLDVLHYKPRYNQNVTRFAVKSLKDKEFKFFCIFNVPRNCGANFLGQLIHDANTTQTLFQIPDLFHD